MHSLISRTECPSDSLFLEFSQGRNVDWLLIFTARICGSSPNSVGSGFICWESGRIRIGKRTHVFLRPWFARTGKSRADKIVSGASTDPQMIKWSKSPQRLGTKSFFAAARRHTFVPCEEQIDAAADRQV